MVSSCLAEIYPDILVVVGGLQTLAVAGVHGHSTQVLRVEVEHIFQLTLSLQLFLDDPVVVGLQTFYFAN